MPIIKSKEAIEKEEINISIEKPLITKVKLYCEWAGLSEADEFFEQAALYVLSKDKDWLNYLE